jgi:hypothetical protein
MRLMVEIILTSAGDLTEVFASLGRGPLSALLECLQAELTVEPLEPEQHGSSRTRIQMAIPWQGPSSPAGVGPRQPGE